MRLSDCKYSVTRYIVGLAACEDAFAIELSASFVLNAVGAAPDAPSLSQRRVSFELPKPLSSDLTNV